MISDSLLTQCHTLALKVASELATKPLHILDAEMLPSYPRNTDCLLGWAHPGDYKDHFIAEAVGNSYQGEDAVIVLDSVTIAKAAEAGQFERCLLNVAVHEAAHLIPQPQRPIVDLPDSPPIRDWQLARMRTMLTGIAPEPSSAGDCHGLDFIRRVLHMYVRAVAAGFDLCLDGLFASHPWSTHCGHWLPLVLSEAMTMGGETFKQIEATPPPPALVDLWQADLDRFKHFHHKEKL